jgi:hypothetical protein
MRERKEIKYIFLLIFLLLTLFLAGCINQPPQNQTTYEKNIIVIENYELSDSTIYNGSSATLRFDIKNKGRDTVEKVKVTFFNLGGFEKFNLNCYKAESS